MPQQRAPQTSPETDDLVALRAKLCRGRHVPGISTLRFSQLGKCESAQLELMARWFHADHASSPVKARVTEILGAETRRFEMADLLFKDVANMEAIDRKAGDLTLAPTEVLRNGGADCGGKSILLACMLDAVGFKTLLVAILHKHVFLSVLMPGSSLQKLTPGSWYEPEGESVWIAADPAQGKFLGWMNRKLWEKKFEQNRVIALQLWKLRQPSKLRKVALWAVDKMRRVAQTIS